ncbi:hypothetical protein, partial [Agrobacterium sp. NPDC089420]|uniref:hypothetical protein n=1 Tax=Agrobacterium sp. NPDC089420 TaxID=3363918 RepID=UPI00384D9262
MEISNKYNMRIPAQYSTSTKEPGQGPEGITNGNIPRALGAGASGSAALQNLNTTLSANALNSQDTPLSRTPTVAGMASPALAAALANGVVNPVDWLSPSDIALFEKTTGSTIQDGYIYNEDGTPNTDPAKADLINSLFQMRNLGTFSGGQPKLLNGDITADDLKAFISYNRSNSAVNTQILDKVLDALTSSAQEARA